MLKLLTCVRGHFWESAVEPTPDAPLACPECGAPADDLPLIDLAPADVAVPPVIPPLELALLDENGKPNVAGFEIGEDLGRTPARVRRYRARQMGVNRDVLLEVVLAREDATQQAWNSLRGEASALGKLSHANVISVFDVGERERQLFYNAVELVDGPTLDQKVADKPLSFPQIMRLVELLARAVDHAHKKNVLHRNLRPASVLLQPVESAKDDRIDPGGAVCQLHGGFYVPKLTGFGIVRKAVEGEAIDAEAFADDTGYMTPEQVWGRARDLGPETDVYGLGGILYFLLTGRAPFRGPSYPDVLDAIQTAPLTTPSSVRRVPADLEAICLRALTRTPRRRYASAGAMAEDLRRAQLGRPVEARKSTGMQRLGRLIGRRPLSSLMAVLLAASLIGLLVAYQSGKGEAEEMRQREQRARQSMGYLETELAMRRRDAGRTAQVQEFLSYKAALDRAADALAAGQDRFAMNQLRNLELKHQERAGFELHYLLSRAQRQDKRELTDFDDNPIALALGANRTLVTVQPGKADVRNGPRKGKVRLFDARTLKERLSWEDPPGPVHAVAINPDGTRLALAGGDNTDTGGTLRVFKIGPEDNGEFAFGTDRPDSRLTGVGYAATGDRLLLMRGNGFGSVLGAARGEEMVPTFGSVERWGAQTTKLEVASGTAIAYTPGQHYARAYNVTTGGAYLMLQGQGEVTAVAIVEPQANAQRVTRVAVANANNTILISELGGMGTPTDEVKLTNLPRAAARLAFSPDGTRLAAALADGTIRLWALAGGVWLELPLALTPAGSEPPAGLAFSGDGKALVAAGGKRVVVWGVVE